jgi:hypothetical protein
MTPTDLNELLPDEGDDVVLREGAVMVPAAPDGLADGDDSVVLGAAMPPTPADLEPPDRDVLWENCASVKVTDESKTNTAKPMVL